MQFEKGKSGNPAGRPKGATHKFSAEQRDFMRDFLLSESAGFIRRMKKLNNKDYVRVYLAMMQYVLPRPTTAVLKEVPTLEAFIAMTREERQVVIEEVRESIQREDDEEIKKKRKER